MTIANDDILIGIDLGGTKINAGRIENGRIAQKKYSLIPSNSDNEWDVLQLIIDIIKALETEGVKGVGIGIPSIVDREKGIAYDVHNIKSWKKVNVKEILEKETGLKIFTDNDANCFALGEYRFGKGSNCKSMVGLTIGTGMGAGIINNGFLIKDANGGAGEFGLIPYLDSTYEDYCSGAFFKRIFGQGGDELFAKATEGDQLALSAFAEYGRHLGNAIKMIRYAIDPNTVVVGGSVAKSHVYYEKSMHQALMDFAFPSAQNNFKIIFSNTADIAILGAASLYYDQLKF
jgi:glucokinase